MKFARLGKWCDAGNESRAATVLHVVQRMSGDPDVLLSGLAAVATLLCPLACVHAEPSSPGPSLPGAATGGFAVVKLFTSDGCSSCPLADAALAELIAATRGQPVYALAFHVDYRDHLGWADPFAQAAFTQRQYAYARGLRLDSVYTPQAIVNGTRAFVGADRAMPRAADVAVPAR